MSLELLWFKDLRFTYSVNVTPQLQVKYSTKPQCHNFESEHWISMKSGEQKWVLKQFSWVVQWCTMYTPRRQKVRPYLTNG